MIATTPRRQILLGSFISLGAAICFGSSQLIEKMLVTSYAPPLVTASFTLFFGMATLGVLAHRGVVQDLRNPKGGLLFTALAGLAGACGVMFNLLALSQAPVIVVAPIGGLNPLISLLLAHLFLQRLERVTWRILLGAMLVVAGVTLITVGSAL